MKQEVTLITCDDDGFKATSMHEVTLIVDGTEFKFDAHTQGCAVRLVHAALVGKLEEEAAIKRRRSCDYCEEHLPLEDGWHIRVDPEGIEGDQRMWCQRRTPPALPPADPALIGKA